MRIYVVEDRDGALGLYSTYEQAQAAVKTYIDEHHSRYPTLGPPDAYIHEAVLDAAIPIPSYWENPK